MFRRRRRDRSVTEAPEQTGQPEQVDRTEQTDPGSAEAGERPEGEPAPTPKSDRSNGPYDIEELDVDAARQGRVDLGGLLIRGVDGMKVQIQVDKRSGMGTSVVLSTGDAGVQLMAIAAPRSSGMWDQTRLQMIADARRRGGNAEEAEGPFGIEARIVLPVKTPDGKAAVQPSRVSGIDGPRWMLRATFVGAATTDNAAFTALADIVRATVVVRGSTPMAPGELIGLRPPTRPAAPDPATTPGDVS